VNNSGEVGVGGGSPESVVRAVWQELQSMLAIIVGDPQRFVPYVDIYHRAAQQLRQHARSIGIPSPGDVAATDELAREQLWSYSPEMFGRLRRGHFLPPVTRDRYLAEVEHGSLCVGSPETIARKIAGAVPALGIRRFDMKYLTGPMPRGQSLDGLRLYGARKVRMVQEMVAKAVVAKAVVAKAVVAA